MDPRVHFETRPIIRIPYWVIPDRGSKWQPDFLMKPWPRWLVSLPPYITYVQERHAEQTLRYVTGALGYSLKILFIDDVSFLQSGAEEYRSGILFLESSRIEQFADVIRAFNNVLVLSSQDSIRSELRKLASAQTAYCDDIHEVFHRLPEFLRCMLAGDSGKADSCAEETRAAIACAPQETWEFPNFKPAQANFFIRGNISRFFLRGKTVDRPIELEERAKTIVTLSRQIDQAHLENKESWLPPLVLIHPSLFLLKLQQFHVEIKNKLPAGLRNHAEKALKIEQNTSDYTFRYETRLDPELTNALVAPVVEQTGKHFQLLDNMALLHASFGNSPIVRCPLKGGTILAELSYFAPENFPTRPQESAVHSRLVRLGERIASETPEEIISYLRTRDGEVLSVSDLPIEWMNIDQVPLSFSHDVCRLPEYPPTTLLSHVTKSSLYTYSIAPEILSRTLIVNLSPGDKVISHAFDAVRNIGEEFSVQTANCSSVEELKTEIETKQPELLIFFTHGGTRKDKSDSVLVIGDSCITGDDIVKHGLAAPMNILFACKGAPLAGYYDPLAQAMFEAHALSVLSSMLPIGAQGAAVLCCRIIWNLSRAAVDGIHRNWLGFVSHCVRTSLFESARQRLMRAKRVRAEWFLSGDEFVQAQSSWQLETMKFDSRAKAYKDFPEHFSKILSDDGKQYAGRLIGNRDFEPESLYYTHWGRPDLIPFRSWIKRFTKPQDSGPSVG